MNSNSLLRDFILPGIHLAFLAPVIWNFQVKSNSFSSFTLIGLIGIIPILAYYFYKSEIKESEKLHLNYLIPIGIYFGAFSTFFLNHQLDLGPVIGAGAVGLLGSFANHLPIKNSSTLPAIIYCGTFIGMSSELTNHPMVFVAVASLFSSVFYQLTDGKLNGIGGKLGSLAFGGVFIAYFIVKWI